jgi:chemotaxis protein methyltransferase CheR
LVYQKAKGKQKNIERLAERLNPNGYLILEAGESLLGISDRFFVVNVSEAIFYQIESSGGVIKKGA